MDHAFGRGKGRRPEAVETCWALHADCHREKTDNDPSGADWWRRFGEHCERHGYADELKAAQDRFAFVTTRGAL